MLDQKLVAAPDEISVERDVTGRGIGFDNICMEIKRPLPPITEVTEPFAPEEVSSKIPEPLV